MADRAHAEIRDNPFRSILLGVIATALSIGLPALWAVAGYVDMVKTNASHITEIKAWEQRHEASDRELFAKHATEQVDIERRLSRFDARQEQVLSRLGECYGLHAEMLKELRRHSREVRGE